MVADHARWQLVAVRIMLVTAAQQKPRSSFRRWQEHAPANIEFAAEGPSICVFGSADWLHGRLEH